jgi:hypothetical protein
MITKTFEIRDAATFIPALAIKLEPGCEADGYLLARAGYGGTPEKQSSYVLLAKLDGAGGPLNYDRYSWPNRTMRVAHRHIIDNFDELEPGAVIDVEFILGERAEPKQSESTLVEYD